MAADRGCGSLISGDAGHGAPFPSLGQVVRVSPSDGENSTALAGRIGQQVGSVHSSPDLPDGDGHLASDVDYRRCAQTITPLDIQAPICSLNRPKMAFVM